MKKYSKFLTIASYFLSEILVLNNCLLLEISLNCHFSSSIVIKEKKIYLYPKKLLSLTLFFKGVSKNKFFFYEDFIKRGPLATSLT